MTANWIDSRIIQTLQISPAQYNVQFASGYYADFTFQVTSDGKIDYSKNFDGFLAGRGTARLTITGFAVTLDARYLFGSGVLLCNMPLTAADWISHQTIRLLPGSHHRVLQGSAMVSSFTFKIGLDGTLHIWRRTTWARAVPRWQGDIDARIFGYPVLVDGRHHDGTGVLLADVWGLAFSNRGVLFNNLLPMTSPFRLIVASAQVIDAMFSLGLDGAITPHPSNQYQLACDQFHGLRRVTLTANV